MAVIPPDTTHHLTAVGATPLRALIANMPPAGQPPLIPRPDVTLPNPFTGPAALPRTGDDLSWGLAFLALLGAAALAAGLRLRKFA
jgi:LPXTG-motif cell wall-anchored protein